jgi:ankyrin repeat protein
MLVRAIVNGDVEEVRALLAAGASPNEFAADGYAPPLGVAAELEYPHIAELLLAAGADINKPDGEGDTPLHLAVIGSIDGTIQTGGSYGDVRTDTIQFLLDRGADPEVRNDNGETPRDWARYYKCEKLMELLQAKARGMT